MPPPSEASSETRIANTSATTQVPIANAPPRSQSTTAATGIAIARAEQRRERHRQIRVQRVLHREEHDRVRADPDERLLPDRDEPAVPGECVPHHREDHEEVQLDQVVERVLRRAGTARRRAGRSRPAEPAGERPRQPRPPLDANRPGASRGRSRGRRANRTRPCARRRAATSTARNTTMAAERKYCTLISALRSARRPSTMPPSERPPERADPADHDRLEGEDELRRRRRTGRTPSASRRTRRRGPRSRRRSRSRGRTRAVR